MAFVLGKPRRYRFDVAGVGISLYLREFTSEERDEFEKKFRSVVNHPKKEGAETYEDVLKQAAELILVDWSGVVEPEPGKPDTMRPVALTSETKAAFFAEPETAKFWRPAVRGYLFPGVSQGE